MRNRRKSRDHLYYSIVEVGQNIKKSLVDLLTLGLRKGNVKRETEPPFVAAKINAITTNYGLMVSLFNGISTFVGYLMPKPFS